MSRSKQVSRKKFILLTTGGTIASVKTQNGRTPGINGETLIRQIDGLEQLCQVEIRPVCSIDSTDLTPKHWKLLVETIRDFYEDYDGFVISHGTDTMAYTAAALSVMLQGLNKPVILTGSQLPMEAAGTDAKQNLYDAFLYGVRPEARGVSVVFNGKVIDGLCARKWKTESFDAFVSINRPLLATIENGRVKIETTAGVFRECRNQRKAPILPRDGRRPLCAQTDTGNQPGNGSSDPDADKGCVDRGVWSGWNSKLSGRSIRRGHAASKRERLSYSDGDTGFAGRNGFECVRSGTSGKERVGHGRIRKTYGRSSHSLHDVADGSSGERKYIGNM